MAVDRKSQDATKEIAQAKADTFFEFDFNNDFSEIRNKLIEKSSGDWILISDGHEIWKNIERLPEIFNIAIKKYPDMLGMAFMLEMGGSDSHDVGFQGRLYKAGLMYKYPVHNRIDANTDKIVPVSEKIISIYHHRDEKTAEARKKQRDKMVFEYFEDVLKKNPHDLRALVYLGRQLCEKAVPENRKYSRNIGLDNFKKAELNQATKYFEHYLEVQDKEVDIEKYLIMFMLAKNYIIDKKIDKVEKLALKMIDMFPYHGLGQALLASIRHMKIKEDLAQNIKNVAIFNSAIYWYKQSCDTAIPKTSIFFPVSLFTWIPYDALIQIYSIAGDIKNCLIHACETLKYENVPPSKRAELLNLVCIWRKDFEEKTEENFDSVWRGYWQSNYGNAPYSIYLKAALGESRHFCKTDMVKLGEYYSKFKVCQQNIHRISN